MTAPEPTLAEPLVRVVREFKSPIAVVWSALTDPDQAPAWWGPRGYRVPRESIDTDLEVGGLYRACLVREHTGEERWWSGVHTDIEPPNLFIYTHAWDRPDGTRGFETEVVIQLEEAGGGTRMTLTQGPYESADRRDSEAAGWEESLDRLGAHLDRHLDRPA